jgi:hypothetical protein
MPNNRKPTNQSGVVGAPWHAYHIHHISSLFVRLIDRYLYLPSSQIKSSLLRSDPIIGSEQSRRGQKSS